MIRRLIAPLTATVVVFHAGQVMAQGAFPAPLPGKAGTANDPAFPPVNGAAPATAFGRAPAPSSFPGVPPSSFSGAAPASFPGAASAPMASSPFAAPPTQSGAVEQCMKQFLPLRDEAAKRGQLLKAAGDRHAGPDEACKLMTSFIQSEVKMIKFVETNSARCQIPPQVADQLNKGHKRSEDMRTKICAAAAQMQKQGPVGPTLSDVLGSATALPEVTVAKKGGGGVFQTLNGNALTR